MEKKNIECKSCQIQLDKVREIKHLGSPDLFILDNPKRILNVHYPVRMDNGDVKMVNGFRVQYNNALGPTKGGIRFHETVDQEDVIELSFLMSLKTSLLKIPYGGAKGGVRINPKELSEGEIERVARGYVRAMFENIGPQVDIPAPDVNTNPQTMAWMMDEYERILGEKAPGSFTGKPIEVGGSLGRDKSTARGAFFIIRERFKDVDKSNIKVAIQGFGNAGSHLAKMMVEEGFKIVSVSDSKTAVLNYDGLDVDKLIEYKSNGKSFQDYSENVEKISNEDLLELDVDLLIPAALGGVIHRSNAVDIKAKTIVEVANAPISADADEVLEKKNIEIIPDILANAGGVVVSYFEWVQNLQNFYWDEERIDEKLHKMMIDAYKSVIEETKKHSLSIRTASYTIAIHRILEAERLRGSL